MARMIGLRNLQTAKPNRLHNAVAVAATFVVVSLLIFNTGSEWFLAGMNLAYVSVYLLFIGALGLAVHRRNQILKLQADLVSEQEQEIALIHAAINTHALVTVTDPQGFIISVNQNFADRYGYSKCELVGKSMGLIYPDGTSDPVFLDIRKSLAAGKIWAGECEEMTADGAKVFMRSTIVPMRDEAGRHVRSVAIRTDNTDFHRAERARFLKNLFDHLQDEVYIFNARNLNMVYANHSALNSSGWSADDLSNKSIFDADPNMDKRFFRAYVTPLFSGEKEVVSIDVNRGKMSGEISTRMIRGDDGEMLFVSVLRDATERKKIERAKMESVSVVSHELRTPLTSIKGSLRLLNSGALGTFDEKAQSVLDIAVRNTERLLLVVNDILDLEKIRAGKMKMEKSNVDLVPFINEVVAMNKGYGDELRVAFEFKTDLESAHACIAPERMTQVLANLLSNAAKYSPTFGTVHIGLREEENYWRISVTDDGPGIPEEGRSAVFESFSQLKSADGQNRKGTGLGLTISQKIVHAHKGVIDFESELGKGTTFYFKLPRHLPSIVSIDAIEAMMLEDISDVA